MFTENDRGQVGIGTLIVFIAMVLVAAIAAGVLINTAGMLQSSAEDTADESTAQVTDNIQVQSVFAFTDAGDMGDEIFDADGSGDDDDVSGIKLLVQSGSGAGDIDLEDASIQVEADGDVETITFGDTGEVGDGLDDLDGQTNDEEFVVIGDTTVLENDNRLQVAFEVEEVVGAIDEGEQFSIEFTTAAGSTTFVEKRAPSNLDGEEAML